MLKNKMKQTKKPFNTKPVVFPNSNKAPISINYHSWNSSRSYTC